MDEARFLNVQQFLRRIVPTLSDEAIRDFCARGTFRHIVAGHDVVRAGDVCDEALFIHRGTFRYYLLHEGKEHTKDFSPQNSMSAAFTSLMTRTPSQLYLAAVEDSEVTAWPANYLLPLLDGSLVWQTLARRIAEALYIRKERREISFLLDTAQERYERFLAEFPAVATFADVEQKVAQHHIASYLGLTPETLSRVRRKRSQPR